MKTNLKKYLAFIMLLCFAFLCIVSSMKVKAAVTYEATEFGEGEYIITTYFNGATYYLPAATSSSGPSAESFTDVSEIDLTNVWTVTKTGDNYYIQNSEGSYLYTTSANNGVRVGTTQHAWIYDSSSNSLQNATTSRYLGIYNASNWRCYTTVDQSNYMESSTSFVFYKVTNTDPSITIAGTEYTKMGATREYTATLKNTTGTVSWSSSTESVATIDENGLLTPVSVGTTTITASLDGVVSNELVVKVYPDNTDVITVTEALEICEFTGTTNTPYDYKVVGTVGTIETEYDSSFDNITLNLTDGTNNIKAYRLAGGSDLTTEMEIQITGQLVNYGGTTPEIVNGEYELVLDETTTILVNGLNNIQSYMSMAYKYTAYEQTIAAGEVTDTLNRSLTGISNSTYVSWTGKSSNSAAVYAGSTAGGNDAIQLRSSKSADGIVTTTSGGVAKKVTITWNATTTTGRQLDIYGSNTAYTDASELYGDNQGTLIGSLTYDGDITTAELTIDAEYTYLGIRSSSGALYLDSIEVVWLGEERTEEAYKDVDFRFRCGVDTGVASLEGLADGETYIYGIEVSTDSKTRLYSELKYDEANNIYYVVISLGDVLNNQERLTEEFTVRAYVEYNGQKYYSDATATYSVSSIVDKYLDEGVSEVNNFDELLATLGY